MTGKGPWGAWRYNDGNAGGHIIPELTLESLAARIAELERKLAAQPQPPDKDWRSIIGMLPDDDFTRSWIAETEAIREANRQAAREGRPEDECHSTAVIVTSSR